MLTEAYLGLADVFIRCGDYDTALAMAELGYNITGAEALQQKIEQIERGSISDSSGRTRRMSWRGEGGSLLCYIDFTYENNRMTGATGFDGAGNQTGHVDITSNEAGQPIQGYTYSPNQGLTGYNIREYDADGNEARLEYYNLSGELNSFRTYEYNELGQRVRANAYLASGELDYYTVYERDENGYTIASYEYYYSSYEDQYVVQHYRTYERNEAGQALVEYVYRYGRLSSRFVYEYDDNGNRIRQTQYNRDGNVIEVIEYAR